MDEIYDAMLTVIPGAEKSDEVARLMNILREDLKQKNLVSPRMSSSRNSPPSLFPKPEELEEQGPMLIIDVSINGQNGWRYCRTYGFMAGNKRMPIPFTARTYGANPLSLEHTRKEIGSRPAANRSIGA